MLAAPQRISKSSGLKQRTEKELYDKHKSVSIDFVAIMCMGCNKKYGYPFRGSNCHLHIQSTLVISTSVISNNRLSRRENLVRVLTQKSKIRLQNIVEKMRNCS